MYHDDDDGVKAQHTQSESGEKKAVWFGVLCRETAAGAMMMMAMGDSFFFLLFSLNEMQKK